LEKKGRAPLSVRDVYLVRETTPLLSFPYGSASGEKVEKKKGHRRKGTTFPLEGGFEPIYRRGREKRKKERREKQRVTSRLHYKK